MKKSVVVSLPAFLLTCVFAAAPAAEEQIVIDDLTVAELRKEIKKIETEYYRVFNTLNINDTMDIICHRYTPTGSNIRREACEPQFVIDRRGQNAADSFEQRDELLSPPGLQKDLESQFQALTVEVNTVASINPYFKELSSILGELRARLEEKKI